MPDMPDVLVRRSHTRGAQQDVRRPFSSSTHSLYKQPRLRRFRNEKPFAGQAEGGRPGSWSRGTALRRRRVVFDRKTRSTGGVDGHHNQCFRVDDERDGESASESENA